MSWKRSDVIALGGLIVAIIVALATKDVQCFLRLQSESCSSPQITQTSPRKQDQNDEPSKEPNPNEEPQRRDDPGTNRISKETRVNYAKLRDLLAEGKWKEADRETAKKMFQAAGREKERSLDREDVNKFPCEDLRIINQLWLDYSDGKFGFSVQKDIYKELGGTEKILSSWATKVGWKVGDKWFSWSQRPNFIFNFTFKTAPKGQLPTDIYDSLIDDYRREEKEYAVYICSTAGLECVIETAQMRIVPMGEMFSKADECL